MTTKRLSLLGASMLLGVLALSTSLDAASRKGATGTVPNDHHKAMLVHNAVAALEQANATGNYTVLRALSAPAFQRANNAQRLAKIFARLRQSNISLAPAILYDPLLSQPANINPSGRLQLVGFFPTAPMRIHFNLQFEWIDQRWRLFGISIQPRSERQARAG